MQAAEINLIQVRGIIKRDEPMKKHTSWQTGGCVDCYFKPADLDDLYDFLTQIPRDEPLFWIGLGSNLLVRDKGFRGTIIAIYQGLNDTHLYNETYMHVGAGVTCAKIARISAKSGLTGGEFLAGIPGTIGGALAMNAGAFGNETWDIVEQVEIIDRQGCKTKKTKNEFDIAYRHVDLANDHWFIAAELSFTLGEEKKSIDKIRTLLNKRSASQPIGKTSCGSVFRNPDGAYAAKLIEDAHLKGESVNTAYVSEKHANFIINPGNASATDIESLILSVQEKVHKSSGIKLVSEVVIIGEHP